MFNCERVASCWRKSCLSRGLGLVARLASGMSSERGQPIVTPGMVAFWYPRLVRDGNTQVKVFQGL